MNIGFNIPTQNVQRVIIS